MKTYHLKDLLKKEILIIELPEGAKIQHFTFEKKGFDGIAIMEKSKEPFLIKGSYTILGSPDEIKEEGVKDLVDEIEYGGERYYKSYLDGFDFCDTAIESFNSALEKEVYWVNHLGAEMPDFNTAGLHIYDFLELKEKWHEAQEKTFDRNRTIIFIEN